MARPTGFTTSPSRLGRCDNYADTGGFFNLLVASAAQSLLELGADPRRLGGLLGITAVLHTWTRDLRFHPHVHCVVTGGGLAPDGDHWIQTASRGRFLFPVRVLSSLFRGKLLDAVRRAWDRGELRCPEFAGPGHFGRLLDTLYRRNWVVYAKRPFGGPEQVFAYLGRYTHRVAISNARVLAIAESGVVIATRGAKTVTLASDVFIGRFLQHVLPEGFTKIRHFGLMAPCNVNTKLAKAHALLASANRPLDPVPKPLRVTLALLCAVFRGSLASALNLLAWRERVTRITGVDPLRCRRCGGELIRSPLHAPHWPAPSDSS